MLHIQCGVSMTFWTFCQIDILLPKKISIWPQGYLSAKKDIYLPKRHCTAVHCMYKFHKIIFNPLVNSKSFKVQTQLQKEFGPVLKSAVNSENFGAGKSM